jgi:hypothetical protein
MGEMGEIAPESEPAPEEPTAPEHEGQQPESHANIDNEPTLQSETQVADVAPQEPLPADGWQRDEWTQTQRPTLDEYLQQQTAKYDPGPNASPERQRLFEKLKDGVTKEYKLVKSEFTNGKFTVRDEFGLKPDAMKVALERLDASRAISPALAGDTLTFRIMKDGDFNNWLGKRRPDVPGAARRFKDGSQVELAFRGKNFTGSSELIAEMGMREKWWSSDYATTTQFDHVIAHEYGHAADASYFDPAFKARTEAMRTLHYDELSGYGKTNAAEAFAESFAEWATKSGVNVSASTQAYATKFAWRNPT